MFAASGNYGSNERFSQTQLSLNEFQEKKKQIIAQQESMCGDYFKKDEGSDTFQTVKKLINHRAHESYIACLEMSKYGLKFGTLARDSSGHQVIEFQFKPSGRGDLVESELPILAKISISHQELDGKCELVNLDDSTKLYPCLFEFALLQSILSFVVYPKNLALRFMLLLIDLLSQSSLHKEVLYLSSTLHLR